MTTKKTPAPSSSVSTGKKDVQKLQRAVVDGLEDVKAQEIQVFDTEALSSLFERVVVASGTSNRQTKALASSVVDAVRKAGFPKPRVEGEGNGEWIIVDCGQVVVHVMQPIFRSYYRLEELWGEKPVRLKLGAEKPGLVKAEVLDAAPKSEAKPKASAKAVPTPSLRRSSAAKAGVAEAFPSKAALKKAADQKVAAKKAAAKKAPAKKASAAKVAAAPAAPARSAKVPTVVVNAPAKKVARKAVPKAAPKSQAKAAPARKALAVKAPVRKPAAAKATPRKA
jgi:ribosome-associated protein